ncbi:ATP-binding SpoIIE family protein phosphatase [Streptomyces sp. NPDC005281]|uniref:ATP-binding SpoIIE family protein phosphatase n=1 Tax=Streptomyces sp. NPDC005281 TaxID=3155712 RepID=UPI0033A1CFAB
MSLLLLETEDVAWLRDNLTGARGVASRLAEQVGLDEHRRGEVALAVTEVASNLAKHAVAGTILLRIVRTPQCAGVEFLAVDNGPGIADVAGSMRDGYSTAGTLGIGLGMIARLADSFDLHSLPGQGTVMLARFWPRGTRLRPPDAGADRATSLVEGVTRPISGGQQCGDGWAARWDGSGASAQAVLVMLCDGLGHGPLARKATLTAIRAFRTGTSGSPEQIMTDIHQALADTRGAAVAVARIEPDLHRVSFCGIGNISAAVVTATSKTSLPSRPGTAGDQIRTLRTSTHLLPQGSALIMHSDGLTEHWHPETIPELLNHSPAVIAARLLHTAGKHHDDASVIAAHGLW